MTMTGGQPSGISPGSRELWPTVMVHAACEGSDRVATRI
jgi:hypothetical protein